MIEIDGELKRLFSVRQVKQGRLILRTYSGSHELKDGKLLEVLSAKHSIHPTARSETGATLVHMTADYSDGSKKDHYLLTHAVRDGNFQPIYSRTMIDPRLSSELIPHPRDRIINLGQFEPETWSMHYIVWLSAAGSAETFPSHPAYSSKTVDFERFSLSIAWGFTPNTSRQRGEMVHFTTSSDEHLTSAERKMGYSHGIAPGAFPNEVAASSIFLLNNVIDERHRHPLSGSLVPQAIDRTFRPPKFLPTPPR